MKLNFVLFTASILQAYAKEVEMGTECYSKVDCKVLNIINDAIESGKTSKCKNISVEEEATKCGLEAFGLNKDQAELTWKIAPYAKKCAIVVGTEIKTCAVGCTKQKDRDTCLESCVLPSKVEAEECFEKLAGMSTENASKNAKCMVGCDKDTYTEIFECQYNCRKDVIDALVSKASEEKSKGGESKTKSSGSQSSNPGKSSAYLNIQVSPLTKITLTGLIASFFI